MSGDIIKDCKKYLGFAPYNTATNIVMGDIYFYTDLCAKYGECEVKAMIEQLQSEGYSIC